MVLCSANGYIKLFSCCVFLQDVHSEYCCQGDPGLQGKPNCGSGSAYWQRLKNKSIKGYLHQFYTLKGVYRFWGVLLHV